jgi:hypothetical protein
MKDGGSVSIYQVVLQFLKETMKADETMLDEKRGLLLFISLERAARSQDLGTVERAVDRLMQYFKRRGRPHFIFLAYNYLVFRDGVSWRQSTEFDSEGRWIVRDRYSRKLTEGERTIKTWAHLHRDRWVRIYQRARAHKLAQSGSPLG